MRENGSICKAKLGYLWHASRTLRLVKVGIEVTLEGCMLRFPVSSPHV